MRRHLHEEVFPVPPETLFRALHTPSSIRAWWGARSAIVIAEPGGYWSAAWGDHEDTPDYVTCARILRFEAPRSLVLTDYRYLASAGGLPFDAHFQTAFETEPHPRGSILRVVQEGFPDGPEGDAFYAACEKGWTDTFASLRAFLQHQDRP